MNVADAQAKTFCGLATGELARMVADAGVTSHAKRESPTGLVGSGFGNVFRHKLGLLDASA